MKREIKFRAWDKRPRHRYGENNPQMRYDVQHTYDEEAGAYFGELIGSPDVILMQYTGLKDKNGKDVFENDIVEGNPIGSTGVRRGQVIWMNDGWYVSDETERDQEKRLHEDFFTKVEVLGNIYENPELLK